MKREPDRLKMQKKELRLQTQQHLLLPIRMLQLWMMARIAMTKSTTFNRQSYFLWRDKNQGRLPARIKQLKNPRPNSKST